MPSRLRPPLGEKGLCSPETRDIEPAALWPGPVLVAPESLSTFSYKGHTPTKRISSFAVHRARVGGKKFKQKEFRPDENRSVQVQHDTFKSSLSYLPQKKQQYGRQKDNLILVATGCRRRRENNTNTL